MWKDGLKDYEFNGELKVSEGLNSVERYYLSSFSGVLVLVSEGLNSVESNIREAEREAEIEFQKD